MPLFMDVHRRVSGQTPEDIAKAHLRDVEAQSKYGVTYLRWWFNQQVGSIYCLVEAPSSEMAIRVHREAHGLLPDEIIEVQAAGMEAFLGEPGQPPIVQEQEPTSISTDSAFRTIVFTDLLDSTAMTQRLGDERAFELLRQHDRLMHECLANHRGQLIKHTGDGLMVSFASSARAVDCMVEMQCMLAERNREHELPLYARIGATAGEPVAHDDDLFGAAVQLAARLCANAGPGQILVSGVIRDLCIGKQFDFAEQGPVDLKGFAEPVRIFEVRWRH